MYLHDVLIEKRKKSGLTIHELSIITRISEKTLTLFEKGSAIPTLQALMAICRATNTTPNDMLLGVSLERYPKLACISKQRITTNSNLKSMSWNEKVEYVKMLNTKGLLKPITSYLQRNLGLNYQEAKLVLVEIEKNANA